MFVYVTQTPLELTVVVEEADEDSSHVIHNTISRTSKTEDIDSKTKTMQKV